MVHLTKKQRGFVKDYLETGNKTQAALNNYDTTSYGTAAVIGHENLKKPNVIAYLESKAERAAERVVELSEQEEQLPVALGASKDILDRAGYKPVEKSAHLSINIEVIPTEQDKELAIKLMQLERDNA